MPAPASGHTIQRPDLGAMLYEYQEEEAQKKFIGMKVLPIFDSPVDSADFPKLPVEAMLKLPRTERAPRGTYARDDWEFELDHFSTQEHGIEEVISDKEAKLYRRFFQAELVAGRRIVSKLLRALEKRIAAAVFNATNFTAHSVSTEWDDATANILGDIITGKNAVRQAIGLVPDTLIVGWDTYVKMSQNTAMLGQIKYVSNAVEEGIMPTGVLAKFLGLKQVLVGDAVYDSAGKGLSASISEIWDTEYAMLCKVAESTGETADILEPCIGRTFMWGADSPNVINTEAYREEQRRSGVVRVRHELIEEIFFAESGYLFDNIHA